MFQMLTIILSFGIIGSSFFFNITWSWVALAVIDFFIFIQFFVAKKRYKFKYIEELSEEANYFLTKYCHYFAMPFAIKDLSASAASLQFIGAGLAIIGIFQEYYLGVIFGISNWFIMGAIAVALSPFSKIVYDEKLQLIHDSIFEYFSSKVSDETQYSPPQTMSPSQKANLTIDDITTEDEQKKCPSCAEKIKIPDIFYVCRDCDFVIEKDKFEESSLFCPDCGSLLEET